MIKRIPGHVKTYPNISRLLARGGTMAIAYPVAEWHEHPPHATSLAEPSSVYGVQDVREYRRFNYCQLFIKRGYQITSRELIKEVQREVLHAAVFGERREERDELTGAPVRFAGGFREQVGRLPRAGDAIQLMTFRPMTVDHAWHSEDLTAWCEVSFRAIPREDR